MSSPPVPTNRHPRASSARKGAVNSGTKAKLAMATQRNMAGKKRPGPQAGAHFCMSTSPRP